MITANEREVIRDRPSDWPSWQTSRLWKSAASCGMRTTTSRPISGHRLLARGRMARDRHPGQPGLPGPDRPRDRVDAARPPSTALRSSTTTCRRRCAGTAASAFRTLAGRSRAVRRTMPLPMSPCMCRPSRPSTRSGRTDYKFDETRSRVRHPLITDDEMEEEAASKSCSSRPKVIYDEEGSKRDPRDPSGSAGRHPGCALVRQHLHRVLLDGDLHPRSAAMKTRSTICMTTRTRCTPSCAYSRRAI